MKKQPRKQTLWNLVAIIAIVVGLVIAYNIAIPPDLAPHFWQDYSKEV